MMPFMVKDWLTATMHWACAERGAYIQLLAFQWINGRIPPDVPQLSRIVGVAESDFDVLWQTIGCKFDTAEGGLANNRLEQHRKKALLLRDAHKRGARTANAERHAQRVAVRQDFDAENGLAQRALSTPPTSPSSSPSVLREEKDTETNAPAERGAERVAERVPRGTYWNEDKWILFKLAYPHRAGGAEWTRAMKACRARLHAGHTWEEIIAGAERYASYCAHPSIAITGTRFVKHAATFLGPDKPFLETWEVTDSTARSARWSPPDDEAVAEPS